MVALKERGFRVLAYDRRGHGRSADPGRGYDYDTLSDDLADFIAGKKLDGVTLVAHSFAAGEVARYVSRHGCSRIRGILLISPTTPFLMKTDDNPRGIDPAILAASRARLALDFPGEIARHIGPFFSLETAPDTMRWIKQMMAQTSMQAIMECAKALHETDFRSDLSRIQVPTLVIHGDNDRSAPSELTARRTAALVPNARLAIYEGAPHGLPITHVGRLNRQLIDYVRN